VAKLQGDGILDRILSTLLIKQTWRYEPLVKNKISAPMLRIPAGEELKIVYEVLALCRTSTHLCTLENSPFYNDTSFLIVLYLSTSPNTRSFASVSIVRQYVKFQEHLPSCQ